MKEESQGVVADGYRRHCGANSYGDERARLLAEARLRRADELAGASLWRRISAGWEIEREVRAKLDRKFPRGALYAVRGPF